MIRALAANLHWKAISLLIAVALWSFVVGEPELVTTYSAPIFYKDLPRDFEIASDTPDRVHLELRGPASKLTPDRLSETAILFDLSSVHTPGERTFTVQDDNVNLPSGVSCIRAVPAQLRLFFDRVMTKSVPVQVRTSAPAPTGYEVFSQTVTPARLTIVGPGGRVQQIDSAQTDPIDLSDVFSRSDFRVHAYVPDPQVRIEGEPLVTVSVMVQKSPKKSR
jgi:YbbR domain-containing protein